MSDAVRQLLMDMMLNRGDAQGPYVGRVSAGNIDVRNRPRSILPDGSIATVRSMSFQDDDGKETLVPTIAPDGTPLSNDQAIDLYRRTGQHLGKFDNPDDADVYAENLHQAQAKYYAKPQSVKDLIAQLLIRGAQ